jgi:hypothetical protein
MLNDVCPEEMPLSACHGPREKMRIIATAGVTHRKQARDGDERSAERTEERSSSATIAQSAKGLPNRSAQSRFVEVLAR